MNNHPAAPRVETRATNAVAESDRLREAGHEFDRLMRALVGYLARRCQAIPESRRQHIKDLTRPEGRPASLYVVGANLAAIASDPSLPDAAIEDALLQLEAWFHAMRPPRDASLLTLWSAETHAQGPADIDQQLALIGLTRRDRAAIERAITTTTQHLATQKQLLAALMREHRTLLFQGGHRRIA